MSSEKASEQTPVMVELSDPVLNSQFSQKGFQEESLSMSKPVSIPMDLLVQMYHALAGKPIKGDQE